MKEYPILISNINDFVFCPISVYFSGQYADMEKKLFQSKKINLKNGFDKL